MSFIKDGLKNLESQLKGGIADKLDDPKVRQEVIDEWNAAVNIPLLNENTVEKIFAAIYDKDVSILKKVLLK